MPHLILTLKISNLYLVRTAKVAMLREAGPLLPNFPVDMSTVANSPAAEQSPHTSTVSRRWAGGFAWVTVNTSWAGKHLDLAGTQNIGVQ